MDDTPRCILHSDLTEAEASAIGALMARTWPKPGKDAAFRAQRLLATGRTKLVRSELAPRLFVLFDGEDCIATAQMLPREISTSQGPFWIMGLAGVCTDPDRRGGGLGGTIARAAFGMIDKGVAPFSLFQTSHPVQSFYEKLGACLVENPIIDSTADDPQACPFWDEVAMRYPSGPGWPEGVIDLNGPGY